MKTWEKAKKEKLKMEDRESAIDYSHKKKKLKPTEKQKYRLREINDGDE
jgi:hypothetical protein